METDRPIYDNGSGTRSGTFPRRRGEMKSDAVVCDRMMNSEPWKIRAVQMDLARQMESLDTIRHFIDFARQFEFNTVALYLEGRVRTDSFPYPLREDCYSSDDMREVVAYAASRQIDILPIVSTLGHAELFLCHDPLKPLAELREGGKSRFGAKKLTCFCPSLKATGRFLSDYLTELAEIFPFSYFHIGCDEVWDMGCCSVCAERIQNGESPADIYATHVVRMHQIVTEKLGRRVLMWDDFLEELPSALDAIPTDIILCIWQYDTLVDQTKSHFGCRRRDHRMADYDFRGISYLVSPWAANGVRNTESLTNYAQRFHPMGGLLTLWDGHSLEDQYAVIAFAGHRWKEPQAVDGQKICGQAHVELFGNDDSIFLQALWTATSLAPLSESRTLETFLRGPLTPGAFERANQARLLLLVLDSYRDRVQVGFGLEVLDAILLRLQRELLQHRMQEIMEGFYEGWNGGVNRQSVWLENGRKLLKSLVEVADRRRLDWERRRPNIGAPSDLHTEKFERNLYDKLATFLQEVETGHVRKSGLLEIRYSLPDYFGVSFVRWSIQYEGSLDWTLIDNGIPKPRTGDHSDCPFFTVKLPIQGNRVPIRACLEVTGYGGIGLLWVEARAGESRYCPVRTEAVQGLVHQPERLLRDDSAACWIGEASPASVFDNPQIVKQVHALEIILDHKCPVISSTTAVGQKLRFPNV